MATPKNEAGKAKAKPKATKAGKQAKKAQAKFVRKGVDEYETGPREGSVASIALEVLKKTAKAGKIRFADFLAAMEEHPLTKKKYGKKLPASFDRIAWVGLARVARKTKDRGIWQVVKGK